MKKFMSIIWKAIIIYARMTMAAWSIVGIGTFIFNSYDGPECFDLGDVEHGFKVTVGKSKTGLRKFGECIWWLLREFIEDFRDF